MADDNPRGSHIFLTRHQIAVHCGESTFDMKKQMSMLLRDFEWDPWDDTYSWNH